MVRAFLALDVPDQVAMHLSVLQQATPVGRPVPVENLHLTLAFLGELKEEVLDEVHYAMEALRAPPPEIRFAGLETFDGRDGPRVLVARAEATPELVSLHKAVRARAGVAGLRLPRERYRPHVTLKRFRRETGPAEIEDLRRFLERNAAARVPAFTPASVVLFRSELRHDGARHEELARYPLGHSGMRKA